MASRARTIAVAMAAIMAAGGAGAGEGLAQGRGKPRAKAKGKATESCAAYYRKKSADRRVAPRPECEDLPSEPADSLMEAPGADKDASGLAADGGAQDGASAWFPPWPAPGFGWRLSPLVGARFSTDKDGSDATTKTSTSEIGLAGGLVGIPLREGNPGIYFEPTLGVAFGSEATTRQEPDGTRAKADGTYQRRYADLGFVFLKGAYRQEVVLGYGEIEAKEGKGPTTLIHGLKAKVDFALLLKPWWSLHDTLAYARGYGKAYGDVYLDGWDDWLHARLFTDVARASFDVGPGFATANEYAPQATGGARKTASGQITYVRAAAGAQPFWKLVLDAQAKYVLASSDKALGQYPLFRYPDQGLYETTRVVLPKDSLVASYYAGLARIVGGLGVGYRVNQTVLNMGKAGGQPRRTYSEQGVVISYQADL